MVFTKSTLRNILGRETIKLIMRPLLSWDRLDHPAEGYSIMLGVPWDLRHLLKVNLDFLSRTDLCNCHCIHIVFDRRKRQGYEQITTATQQRYPHLPFVFDHYRQLPGLIAERVNVSTFYNSLNCATMLPSVRTRYAILHDFDLYPLVPEYFESVYQTTKRNGWHFCGLEKTHFDGLTDKDNVFGTWCLGMDVQWLRATFHPIDIFHRVQRVDTRLISLDPFSSLELRTPLRGSVAGLNGMSCCHVKNLCSTYLRYTTGRAAKVVWRLHYLWYLEYLADAPANFMAATEAMERADSSILIVGNYRTDFADTDPTCANVLRDELHRMEMMLYNQVRPEVDRYISAFSMFLLGRGKAFA